MDKKGEQKDGQGEEGMDKEEKGQMMKAKKNRKEREERVGGGAKSTSKKPEDFLTVVQK